MLWEKKKKTCLWEKAFSCISLSESAFSMDFHTWHQIKNPLGELYLNCFGNEETKIVRSEDMTKTEIVYYTHMLLLLTMKTAAKRETYPLIRNCQRGEDESQTKARTHTTWKFFHGFFFLKRNKRKWYGAICRSITSWLRSFSRFLCLILLPVNNTSCTLSSESFTNHFDKITTNYTTFLTRHAVKPTSKP